MIAAHADWSTDPRKRWVTIARRRGRGWSVQAARRVEDPHALAAELRDAGGAALLALDLPLGLPRAYAAGCAETGFPAFLRGLVQRPGFFTVNATVATISREAPFYPARPAKGMRRAAHAEALGLADAAALSRLCDRATSERPAGAPLFWTLGANQAGKAAIAAWRDWLAPALAAGAPDALWPFEGRVAELLAPGRLVLAEAYPAEAMRQIGVTLAGSKRAQAPRRAAAEAIHAALAARRAEPDAALAAMIADGFGADAAGEDRFDSLMGLIGALGVLDGAREDFIPDDPWLRRWEGWVLGQTALPRDYPAGV
jgi:hypothetical protein